MAFIGIEMPGRPNGYSKLASLMGQNPEVAIFRRFNKLNARNLLYLQAELAELEERLERATKADQDASDPNRKIYDRHWLSLSECGTTPGGDPEQWNLVLEMRAKLKEYNEALFLQTVLQNKQNPLPADLNCLRDWMEIPTRGYVYLLGADHDTWSKSPLEDLISLKRPEALSPVTQYLGRGFARNWMRCSRKTKSSVSDDGSIVYSEEKLLRLGALLGTVLASTMPVVAIVVLSFVTRMKMRLAVIALFTALFSTLLGLFSNGKAVEIFTATSGFAAVQVVFVGTSSGGTEVKSQ